MSRFTLGFVNGLELLRDSGPRVIGTGFKFEALSYAQRGEDVVSRDLIERPGWGVGRFTIDDLDNELRLQQRVHQPADQTRWHAERAGDQVYPGRPFAALKVPSAASPPFDVVLR